LIEVLQFAKNFPIELSLATAYLLKTNQF